MDEFYFLSFQPKPKKKKTEKKVEKKPEKTEPPKKPAGGAEKGPGGEMMFQVKLI